MDSNLCLTAARLKQMCLSTLTGNNTVKKTYMQSKNFNLGSQALDP